jgi:hypothetical protein
VTRRLVWMGIGAVAAIVVARRVRTALRPYTEAAAPVTGLVDHLRTTVREVRTTMVEHEAELRAMLVEDAGDPDRPRTDPRGPHHRSWTSRVDDDEDEIYSF